MDSVAVVARLGAVSTGLVALLTRFLGLLTRFEVTPRLRISSRKCEESLYMVVSSISDEKGDLRCSFCQANPTAPSSPYEDSPKTLREPIWSSSNPGTLGPAS